MSFYSQLKTSLDEELNVSVTENLALGYKTTGKNLLDLNFAVASLRGRSEQEIINLFIKAYFEDRKAALVWLFYARDVRGGLGERRLFRIILQYLTENHEEVPISNLVPLVPEYGRFDDLLLLLETKVQNQVIALIQIQLHSDIQAMEKNENISLLAKWLPSVNASNENTKKLGKLIAKKIQMTEKEYRKTLSKLRSYLDVVECKLSSKRFDEIKYEAVPSKANLLYKNAFLRNDEERRLAYLEQLVQGETKINASVLYPYEIVNAYNLSYYDETLEQLWKNLPDIPALENTIVVADGSGSMQVPIGNSDCIALSVANALAIYFAEKSSGDFKDQYITFSQNPQLVDLSKGKSLKEKLQIALAYDEIANTDIYKVFQLILHTAQTKQMEQAELPKNIIIISDMEFDRCAQNAEKHLFTQIKDEYNKCNYSLPRLIFWNVNSRTNTIPLKENELGVALVSGFSVSIAKMILSLELDPYKCMLDILNNERYDLIRNAVKDME